MAMVRELHNQDQDTLVYACNSCQKLTESRYQCTVCTDFDLCVDCFNKEGHQHEMEKFGFGSEDDSASGDKKQAKPRESLLSSIQRCIRYLVHACQCRDAACRLLSCQKMKRVIQHARRCKQKNNGGCPLCKQLIALCCYHAKYCEEARCSVPFCSNIKNKLMQQQLQERLRQAIRRRITAIQNHEIVGCEEEMPRGLF